MGWELALPPLTGALIGWSTNAVAVRLLFRPHRPLRLGPLVLQGLLPRRRHELAESLADAVAGRLLDPQAVAERILGPEVRAEVADALVESIAGAVRRRLPGFLPASVREPIVGYVAAAVRDEAARLAEARLPELVDGMLLRADLGGIIRERLAALDLVELERLIRSLAARELRHIEWAGGVLGFAVGLLQALVTALAR